MQYDEHPEYPGRITTSRPDEQIHWDLDITPDTTEDHRGEAGAEAQSGWTRFWSAFVPWPEPTSEPEALPSAPHQSEKVEEPEIEDSLPSRGLYQDPRRLLWPRSQQKEADVEQGSVPVDKSEQQNNPRASANTLNPQSSRKSQTSTGSFHTGHKSQKSTSSHHTDRSSQSESDASTRSFPTSFRRWQEQLAEGDSAPTWIDISPTPPQRPTTSSTTSSQNCSCPHIPDPVDPARRLSKNQIWWQRVLVWAIVLVINSACVIAYVCSSRHLWVLALILFVKAKDVLSVLVAFTYLSGKNIRKFANLEKLEPVAPKQILSLITCYSESEEQIMKTVTSICDNELEPHSNIICILVDGKPKDQIKRQMIKIVPTIRRPYFTWLHKRNEVTVDCGFLDGMPMIFIEKVRNHGKKDSLILGHDLFNVMRDNAPQYTKLLREEIWTTMIPSLMGFPGDPRIDAIFCTDADSTIHKDAMRRLADSLGRNGKAIAACGILLAELGDTEWTIWSLFQQFQYSYGQMIRRQAEGVWGRVTCLPGCITMIACRPEMASALRDYAAPVRDRFFPRHQVQYLGTDRRLTYSMLSQGTDLETIFVPDAVSETVVPQSIMHYLNQRRRWGSNAYFNDWYYFLGQKQFFITRLWAMIDISRMSIVYVRQANNILFLYGLVRNFAVIKVIPLLIVTMTPFLWFVVVIICTQPLLRRRLHKLFIGLLINYCISWCLSILVFSRIIFQLGSTAWGRTGTSSAPRDPALTMRTPRPSIARRLSSLFGGSNSSGDAASRRTSHYSHHGSTVRDSSIPPVPWVRQDSNKRSSAEAGPSVAGMFSNVIWNRSRERLSRTSSATQSQSDLSMSRDESRDARREAPQGHDRQSVKSDSVKSITTV